MDKETHTRYVMRAEVAKALAHPTRLFLLEELSKGERCVCELVDMIGDDFSTVSKHLAILKNVGLVSDEKRGLKVFYRLTCPCVRGFFDCIENVLRESLEHRMMALR